MKHLAFVLALTAAMAACGDDGTGAEDDDGGTGAGTASSSSSAATGAGATGGSADEPCDSPGVYCDADAGLMWQVETESQAGSKSEANATCSALELAGFSDWRLPDISELRSLIRGCAQTEPGGACGVTTSCVEYACIDSCSGCAFGGGPGNGGCYWPAELGDSSSCAGFWSANDVPDPIGEQPATWIVDFSFAKVTDEFQGLSGTRCVRAH